MVHGMGTDHIWKMDDHICELNERHGLEFANWGDTGRRLVYKEWNFGVGNEIHVINDKLIVLSCQNKHLPLF